MFNNLVESSSHKEDFSRKGSIFLGTLVAYMLLLLVAGVGGVYAYDARLESQSLELALITFVPVDATTKPPAPERDRPRTTSSTTNEFRPPVRPVLISSTTDPLNVPDKPGTVASSIPPAPPNAVIGSTISDLSGGPIGPSSHRNSGTGAPGSQGGTSIVNPIKEDLPPPPVIKKAPPIVSLGVVNGRAISLPIPPYPPIARPLRAAGTVMVQILIDESGKVVSAQALSGHPLLRPTAVKAAYQARFSPTLLSKQPVKASGVIAYNFILQ
jgi:periplasmic protein TonB